MSNQNVVSLFQGKKKNIAIVMDEIDGMNSGDKGGINTLIKIIRPKKTKKQKLEEISSVPIICIGNNQTDKKIKELMKNCLSIELKSPKVLIKTNLLSLIINESFCCDLIKDFSDVIASFFLRFFSEHTAFAPILVLWVDHLNRNKYPVKVYLQRAL